MCSVQEVDNGKARDLKKEDIYHQWTLRSDLDHFLCPLHSWIPGCIMRVLPTSISPLSPSLGQAL